MTSRQAGRAAGSLARQVLRQQATSTVFAVRHSTGISQPLQTPAHFSQRSISTTPRLFRDASLEAWTSNKPVDYDELKPLTEQPNDEVLLIDVREPDEVIQGSIPSAVNLPLTELPKALAMDEGDFTRKYMFKKPRKDQRIITYCRSGKRSQTAIDAAKSQGYKKNYEGSWLDWSSKEQKS